MENTENNKDWILYSKNNPDKETEINLYLNKDKQMSDVYRTLMSLLNLMVLMVKDKANQKELNNESIDEFFDCLKEDFNKFYKKQEE